MVLTVLLVMSLLGASLQAAPIGGPLSRAAMRPQLTALFKNMGPMLRPSISALLTIHAPTGGTPSIRQLDLAAMFQRRLADALGADYDSAVEYFIA